ncbi:hypothetical protein ACQR3P_29505 [Rhodococcus sp. IEGM1300]
MKSVKKVKFAELKAGSGDTWSSLGGIRFYSNGSMHASGSLISESGLVADLQNFIASASSKYRTHYLIHHAVLTTRDPIGNYPNNGYWLAADKSYNNWFEVEFKETKNIDRIDWVQKPDTQYGARGTANPLKIQFFDEGGLLIQEFSVEGDLTPNAISSLTLEDKLIKYIVEAEGVNQYWTGSAWADIQETG